MSSLKNVALRVTGYRCFGSEPSGFDRLRPLTVLIGRNNSGKSTLLDLIEAVTQGEPLTGGRPDGTEHRLILSAPLSAKEIQAAFPKNTSGGPITGNHWKFGQEWIDGILTWSPGYKNQKGTFIDLHPPMKGRAKQHSAPKLVKAKENPFQGYQALRLNAERNIVPEPVGQELAIQPDGQGFTNCVQRFLMHRDHDSLLIEEKLLAELNEIFEPDSRFSRILVQSNDDNEWEVFFEEDTKGRVALSDTGSGLKTVLLVLAYLHLRPIIDKHPLERTIFCFEELENNIHPALERRLLRYLQEFVVRNGAYAVLTTHSPIAIDFFSGHKNAQVIHVNHDGATAKAQTVTTYVDGVGVLDDLDVRASDLLQANVVVWVEGPTDRIYLKRWIEILTNGDIQEGDHYQCMFYGGRLLAHLSAEDPEWAPDELVKILRVNRHAIVVIDSDRGRPEAELTPTKQRIRDEIEKIGGVVWITDGREIENYLSRQVLARATEKEWSTSVQRYERFNTYLSKHDEGMARLYSRSKVMFAEKMRPYLARTDLKRWGLQERLEEVIQKIRDWNSTPPRVVDE